MEEILVGADGSGPGNAALDWAADEATRWHARLRVVHAGDPAEGAKILPGAVERARALTSAEIVTEQAADRPEQALLERAPQARLVVLGTHGHGPVTSLMVGSAALAVAGGSPVPVVLVKERMPAQPDGSVVVGVAEHPAGPVLDAAATEAWLREQTLRCVHVWFEPPVESYGATSWVPPMETEPIIEALRERLERELEPWLSGPPEATLTVAQGFAREVLAEASAGASLLVLGRHEKPGHRLRALGATSHGLIRDARCPVMIVGD